MYKICCFRRSIFMMVALNGLLFAQYFSIAFRQRWCPWTNTLAGIPFTSKILVSFAPSGSQEALSTTASLCSPSDRAAECAWHKTSQNRVCTPLCCMWVHIHFFFFFAFFLVKETSGILFFRAKKWYSGSFLNQKKKKAKKHESRKSPIPYYIHLLISGT